MPIGCLGKTVSCCKILHYHGIKADVVVAKDGSGKYKKISDALKAVPEKSKKRFVIYVQKGIYNENLRIEKPMGNVMMIGGGIDSTIVSAGLNVVDGTPTFQSASFGKYIFLTRNTSYNNFTFTNHFLSVFFLMELCSEKGLLLVIWGSGTLLDQPSIRL